MYIVPAILAFGFIIAVHELGHFTVAKLLNVKVNELAIGMGPKLFSKQGKETLYSLRLVPFGGFCSMEGEYGERLESDDGEIGDDGESGGGNTGGDEETEPDPRSFMAQKPWRRVAILVAGSGFNLVAAFIIILILALTAPGFGSTQIGSVTDLLPEAGIAEIRRGDKIIAVNGERLFYYEDYAMFMSLNENKPITLTLLRDGERVEYQRRTYEIDGTEQGRYSVTFEFIEPSLTESLKYSCYRTYNFVRLIRVSIMMMFAGEASVKDVAGPVGIVSAINEIASDEQQSPTVGAAIGNIVFFTAFIGVNVAVINLLPIPAMDGGRILFVFITWVFAKITRRELNPKYENYINTVAFFLLIGLMVLILYNDIVRIVSG